MYLCQMSAFYCSILIAIFIGIWISSIFLSCTYFRHPLMWRSKWFILTVVAPGIFLFADVRTKIRYELFTIILRHFELKNSYNRFVLIEKTSSILRKPRRCAICSEKPIQYSTFNTIEFFKDDYLIIGLSCKCGNYYKKFEFGFLNLTYRNYANFLSSIGATFTNSVTTDWNSTGYAEEKTVIEKRNTMLSV